MCVVTATGADKSWMMHNLQNPRTKKTTLTFGEAVVSEKVAPPDDGSTVVQRSDSSGYWVLIGTCLAH